MLYKKEVADYIKTNGYDLMN
jgi:hypothetical protein